MFCGSVQSTVLKDFMCKLQELLGNGLESLDSFEKVFFVLVTGLWGSILDLVKKYIFGIYGRLRKSHMACTQSTSPPNVLGMVLVL